MLMIYNYKAYDDNLKQWHYGELEILVNNETLEKRYYIVNKQNRIEFNKDDICKLTSIKAGKNLEPVYDKDIINIRFEDDNYNSFIVKRGEGTIRLDMDDVVITGLMLHSFGGNDYLFSKNLINNPTNIQIVGNVLENHLNEVNK